MRSTEGHAPKEVQGGELRLPCNLAHKEKAVVHVVLYCVTVLIMVKHGGGTVRVHLSTTATQAVEMLHLLLDVAAGRSGLSRLVFAPHNRRGCQGMLKSSRLRTNCVACCNLYTGSLVMLADA